MHGRSVHHPHRGMAIDGDVCQKAPRATPFSLQAPPKGATLSYRPKPSFNPMLIASSAAATAQQLAMQQQQQHAALAAAAMLQQGGGGAAAAAAAQAAQGQQLEVLLSLPSFDSPTPPRTCLPFVSIPSLPLHLLSITSSGTVGCSPRIA